MALSAIARRNSSRHCDQWSQACRPEPSVPLSIPLTVAVFRRRVAQRCCIDLGINHDRLTYNFQGPHYRLTDAHDEIVAGILQG
jgi:hypothetical protein